MAVETVYALFQTVSDAERAIGALMDHGVPHGNVGVITRRAAEQDEAAHVRDGFTRVAETTGAIGGEVDTAYVARPGALPPAALANTIAPSSTADTAENVNTVAKMGITTTTPEDAKAGAAVGTGIGLLTGLLAAAAAITIPGFGIVLAGGALAAAIGATVATTAAGAVAGGVAGYLRDMGMAEHAAVNYADRVAEGDYLIAVEIDPSEYDNIKRLLEKYNAVGIDINVNAAGEAVSQNWADGSALQQYIMETPTTTIAPPAEVVMDDPNHLAEPAHVLAYTEPVFDAPTHIVTETAAGVPIVPAQVVSDVPMADATHVETQWLGETPEEAELRRQTSEDRLTARRPGV